MSTHPLPFPESNPAGAAAARAAVNRENAQHSTGPNTPEGKQRIRLNAVSHGAYAKTVLLPGEDSAGYAALGEMLTQHWEPANPEDRALVQTLQDTQWRLARIAAMESALLILVTEQHREDIESRFEATPLVIEALARAAGFQANSRQFDQLHRQEARLQRLLDKTERALKLRPAPREEAAQPTAAAPPARAGFVPSKSENVVFPAGMPVFTGPFAKDKQRRWLNQNGHRDLARFV